MDSWISGIRVVSWDLDGTLFSYWRLAAPLARELLRAGSRETRGTIARRIGDAWRFHHAIERQRRQVHCRVDLASLQRYEDAVLWERELLEAALSATPARRRAVAMMEEFSAARIAQVALSDFECASKLKRLRVDSYFTASYSCQSLGFWKPSPIPLTRIQQDFGVPPSRHLHIGDRPDTDGAACRANGCHFMPIDRSPKAWSVFNAICAITAHE